MSSYDLFFLAVAGLARASKPTPSAGVAPNALLVTSTDANAVGAGLLRRGSRADGRRRGGGGAAVLLVDGDQVTAKVMLAAEGATATGMGANEALDTVGVMRGHMRLEIEGPGKGPRAAGTSILLLDVSLATV